MCKVNEDHYTKDEMLMKSIIKDFSNIFKSLRQSCRDFVIKLLYVSDIVNPS